MPAQAATSAAASSAQGRLELIVALPRQPDAADIAHELTEFIGDADLDALYTTLFRELLTYMMEDPRSISACTHLLFIAKNIERSGDHATNIAENVWFVVHGELPGESRPKQDHTLD